MAASGPTGKNFASVKTAGGGEAPPPTAGVTSLNSLTGAVDLQSAENTINLAVSAPTIFMEAAFDWFDRMRVRVWFHALFGLNPSHMSWEGSDFNRSPDWSEDNAGAGAVAVTTVKGGVVTLASGGAGPGDRARIRPQGTVLSTGNPVAEKWGAGARISLFDFSGTGRELFGIGNAAMTQYVLVGLMASTSLVNLALVYNDGGGEIDIDTGVPLLAGYDDLLLVWAADGSNTLQIWRDNTLVYTSPAIVIGTGSATWVAEAVEGQLLQLDKRILVTEEAS